MDQYNYNPNSYDPDRQGRNERSRRQPTDDADRRTPRHTPERKPASRSASKPTPRRRKKEARPGRIISLLFDRRIHGVIGIALIFFALYITVTGISFVRNAAADQTLATNNTISEIAHATATGAATIDNAGGAAGAKLSHALFTESFGIGTIVIIVYLSLLGLSLLRAYRCSFWSLTFKALIDTITLSLVAGLITYPMELSWPVGGYHGHYVNEWLINHTGVLGDILVNCLLVVCVIFIYLNELRLVLNKYRAIREHRRQLAEERREEELRRQEMVRRDLNDKVMGSTDDEEHEHESGLPDTMDFNDGDSEDLTDIRESDTMEQPYDAQTPYTTPVAVDLFAPINPAQTPVAAYDEPAEALYDSYTPVNDETTSSETYVDEYDTPSALKDTDQTDDQTDSDRFEVSTNHIEQSDVPIVSESDRYDPTAELSRYEFPSLDLLHDRPVNADSVDLEEQEENKERITKTLNDYGIPIQRISATVGPTVTLFEIVPADGIRIAKIKRLEDDIALSLAALGVRIIAPIPGKGTIGIEVANKDPQTVSIRSVLGSKAFRETKCVLPMAMGATISNEVYVADLAKMPHLLVAGATGQGKSVGLNTIIASLLYKLHPSRLKFVLVDPKSVEFSLYSKLERHYLAKLPDDEEAVVTNFDKVERTLNSLCVEMDNRYALLKEAGVRSISEYNERFINHRLNPEKGHRFLPYIVTIIDEFADLIMMSGKSVEMPIARIAQKARAVGMHMIIATQRPSTTVITGNIKANFPGRVAFRVSQGVDSKTILDRMGANQLIGRGDLLFSNNGVIDRVQCAFIDTDEVEAICEHIDRQVGYEHAYYLPEPLAGEGDMQALDSSGPIDPLFEEAAEFIVSNGSTASTSSLQRRYSIGYNRAGKIMDQLESAGIVGPASGAKPRAVLVDPVTLDQMLKSRNTNF